MKDNIFSHLRVPKNIITMVDYLIENNREIEYVNVSEDHFHWIETIVNKQTQNYTVIDKTPSTLLVEYRNTNLLFKSERWLADPTYKVQLTKIETINSTYFVNDFYIKLK